MKARGELAHALRNPLAAADANIRFLKEICDDLERALHALPRSEVHETAEAPDAASLLREAREALGDSAQALSQINTRLANWTEGAGS